MTVLPGLKELKVNLVYQVYVDVRVILVLLEKKGTALCVQMEDLVYKGQKVFEVNLESLVNQAWMALQDKRDYLEPRDEMVLLGCLVKRHVIYF